MSIDTTSLDSEKAKISETDQAGFLEDKIVAGTNVTLNILDVDGFKSIEINSTGGAGVWGAITGTLANQTDLNTALGLKYDASNPAGYIANLSSFTTDNLTQGATNLYDQIVSLTQSTGISITGTYPNFTIENTAPDQTVSLTEGTNVTITGTYPNFTISATGGSGSASGGNYSIQLSDGSSGFTDAGATYGYNAFEFDTTTHNLRISDEIGADSHLLNIGVSGSDFTISTSTSGSGVYPNPIVISGGAGDEYAGSTFRIDDTPLLTIGNSKKFTISDGDGTSSYNNIFYQPADQTLRFLNSSSYEVRLGQNNDSIYMTGSSGSSETSLSVGADTITGGFATGDYFTFQKASAFGTNDIVLDLHMEGMNTTGEALYKGSSAVALRFFANTVNTTGDIPIIFNQSSGEKVRIGNAYGGLSTNAGTTEWQFGGLNTGTNVLDTTNYAEIYINGTLYKVALIV